MEKRYNSLATLTPEEVDELSLELRDAIIDHVRNRPRIIKTSYWGTQYVEPAGEKDGKLLKKRLVDVIKNKLGEVDNSEVS